MDDNMDANIDPADQSQAFPTARPITERLNFVITGSGEWSAENLFIFPENVTHPTSEEWYWSIGGVSLGGYREGWSDLAFIVRFF